MVGADVLLGCSAKGLVTQDMVPSRWPSARWSSPWPTPTRRSRYPDAVAARDDVIMATGRSDYPNQVNNVLGLSVHLPGRAGCAGARQSPRE